MKKLENKVALVTGSDSGIGLAIALEFAKQGAKLIVCYHSKQERGEEALKLVQEHQEESRLIRLDVSDEEEVEERMEELIKDFGGIDILVNNSGVNGSGIPIDEMETDTFDKTIRTNLYGTFFCSRKFIQHRKGLKKPGKIINISSVHEEINAPGNADYNASKAGVRNFMRTVALETAPFGINVNNIAPGMILTAMNQEAMDDPEVRKRAEENIPLGRAGKAEEIAYLALFLASEEANYVTGSTYFMDGGLSINIGQGA
ncbi:SDR family oxidoreductase [Pedobacter sp. MC2016-15]|uniref:SDR family NAD(P)-dependent oxidoreductase n=1 Tax=Pedobacter sp. MC2016-15 TaxID=2994473 RepID=UPI0022466A87|nr:SDR family oxidoreductase [Pedobacter sp. MC2016-15]MCX2478080.1 SDR family oxidoreductase [Pedobacter sp. MC2016-15]